MNKALKLSNMLHTFICEMENTLKDKNKRNRAYAPQVFWKNKHTLELTESALNDYEKQDENFNIYGAIWTDKGLIYVAELNEKGELELL